MSLKITTSPIPTERFRQDLREFFSLPEESLMRLATVLESGLVPLPDTPSDIARLANESAMDVVKLNRGFALIRYVLTNQRARGISTEQLEDDLRELGLDETAMKAAVNFFAVLVHTRERVFAKSRRSQFESSGAPSVDSVDFIWNIRPVFGSLAHSQFEQDGLVSEWLSHTYVALMEISASDGNGNEHALSAQLTEEDFEDLETIVKRARIQLDASKKKQFLS